MSFLDDLVPPRVCHCLITHASLGILDFLLDLNAALHLLRILEVTSPICTLKFLRQTIVKHEKQKANV